MVSGPAADLDQPGDFDGGYYELALNLGPRDDARLRRALDVVLATVGIVDRRGSLAESGQKDVVSLPDGRRVVCTTMLLRSDETADWLCFCLPMGALSRLDPRVDGYPFEETPGESLVWRRPIDDWFAGIGRAVYAETGFAGGLIGHEVSGENIPAVLTGDAGEKCYVGYLAPSPGGLRYFPVNAWFDFA